jgi:ribosomal protein S18 acetylase RimI-like enzyme
MAVGACIGIQQLSQADLVAVAEVAARGMVDDPMVVRVFGSDPKKRLRRLTNFYVKVACFIEARGSLLGAFEGGTLVGVIGAMRPGLCQPGPLDALRMIPTLVANLWPAPAFRLKDWLDDWGRHDLPERHWHIGLLSVEPRVQGGGIGTRLMTEHCARMDEAQTVSYLETDQAINVRFYEKFGYRVAGRAPVIGVSNWFMRREPVAVR